MLVIQVVYFEEYFEEYFEDSIEYCALKGWYFEYCTCSLTSNYILKTVEHCTTSTILEFNFNIFMPNLWDIFCFITDSKFNLPSCWCQVNRTPIFVNQCLIICNTCNTWTHVLSQLKKHLCPILMIMFLDIY